MPAYRGPIFGRLIAGLVLICIGASNIYGLRNWWFLIIVVVGILLLVYLTLGLSRKAQKKEKDKKIRNAILGLVLLVMLMGVSIYIGNMEDLYWSVQSTTAATTGTTNSNPLTLTASITSPGDVQTFSHGTPVTFTASVSGGTAPYTYTWTSSIDGSIGNGNTTATFDKNDLSLGLHMISLTVTDGTSATVTDAIEIGIADPSICGNVNPTPKYYPIDTPCKDIWPNATSKCMEYEVCHPDLDYIVEDSVDCCDGTPIGGIACSYANANSGGNRKKCRGLYIIKAFGPEAKYISGYALFKACCSGHPECSRACFFHCGECAFRDGFNDNVKALSCDPEDALWGVESWKSDTDMSKNNCVPGVLPAHATVNILQTGVCKDYSRAVTTLLRKAGYSKNEVYTTVSTDYDLPVIGKHPGHEYNLVLLPGDSKYHIVDTTGNGDGISIGDLPGHFWFTGCALELPVSVRVSTFWVGYFDTREQCFNDAGNFNSPSKSSIIGC